MIKLNPRFNIGQFKIGYESNKLIVKIELILKHMKKQ